MDPDAAPLMQHAFEMKAAGKGHSAIARWLNEQGVRFTSTGVRYMLSNRAYRGETRAGDLVKVSTAPGARDRRPAPARPGPREAVAADGLPGGEVPAGRRRDLRQLRAGPAALVPREQPPAVLLLPRAGLPRARVRRGARELDAFVLNTIEERTKAADPSTWVALPGGDDVEVAELEAARDSARQDLEGFLADTRLRRALGPERHAEAAENYVAVLEKCEADLAEARERNSGSWALVGPVVVRGVGQRGAARVAVEGGAVGRLEGPRAPEPPR